MGNNYVCGRGWKSLEGKKSKGEGSVGKSTCHISLTTWVQYSEFTFFISQLWWYVHICIPGTPLTRWATQTGKSAVNSFTQHNGKTRETLLQNRVEGENPLPRNCTLTSTCVPWQVNTHPCAKTHTHTIKQSINKVFTARGTSGPWRVYWWENRAALGVLYFPSQTSVPILLEVPGFTYCFVKLNTGSLYPDLLTPWLKKNKKKKWQYLQDPASSYSQKHMNWKRRLIAYPFLPFPDLEATVIPPSPSQPPPKESWAILYSLISNIFHYSILIASAICCLLSFSKTHLFVNQRKPKYGYISSI